MPLEPAKRAHLLLVATCELARAVLAPLPAPGTTQARVYVCVHACVSACVCACLCVCASRCA